MNMVTVTIPQASVDYFLTVAAQKPWAESNPHIELLRQQMDNVIAAQNIAARKSLVFEVHADAVASGEIEHGGVVYKVGGAV
jgi:hypothetical protein